MKVQRIWAKYIVQCSSLIFRSGVAGGPGDLHYRDQLQVVQDLQGLLRRRGPRFPQVQVENRGSYVQGLSSRRRVRAPKVQEELNAARTQELKQ